MKKYVLECLGTFILTFLLTGALVLYERTGVSASPGVIMIVYGLTLAVLTLALGKFTGAHLNPAVTLAYSIEGRLPWKEALPYMISQFAGALAASAVLKYLFPFSATLGAVLPIHDEVPTFVQEFSATLILVTGILTVPKDTFGHRCLSAVVAGGLVALAVYFTGPVTGSGMNPARSLAPALFSGVTDDLWIYLTAPVCAAFSAASLHAIYNNLRPGHL